MSNNNQSLQDKYLCIFLTIKTKQGGGGGGGVVDQDGGTTVNCYRNQSESETDHIMWSSSVDSPLIYL